MQATPIFPVEGEIAVPKWIYDSDESGLSIARLGFALPLVFGLILGVVNTFVL